MDCVALNLDARGGQPQRQLAIFADIAINEILQRCRHAAAFKAEAAQEFLRDGVGNILGAVGLGWNMMTRSGSLCCPVIRSMMVVS